MAKKYIVDLPKDEKAELVSLTQKVRSCARKIKRANILLLVDSGKPDVEISVLTEQCLDRRLASQAIVASEVGAWEFERNAVRQPSIGV